MTRFICINQYGGKKHFLNIDKIESFTIDSDSEGRITGLITLSSSKEIPVPEAEIKKVEQQLGSYEAAEGLGGINLYELKNGDIARIDLSKIKSIVPKMDIQTMGHDGNWWLIFMDGERHLLTSPEKDELVSKLKLHRLGRG
jgi:hypothetical protein